MIKIDDKFRKFNIYSQDTWKRIEKNYNVKEILESFIHSFLYNIFHYPNSKVETKWNKFIQTNKGQEFYNEFSEYINSENKRLGELIKLCENKKKSLDKSCQEYLNLDWIENLISNLNFSENPRDRLYRMIVKQKILGLDDLDIVTLTFIFTNIWDILGNFGKDLEVPSVDENDEHCLDSFDNFNLAALDKKGIYRSEYKTLNEKKYTRVLDKDFFLKYQKDINRMYELYYTNFNK